MLTIRRSGLSLEFLDCPFKFGDQFIAGELVILVSCEDRHISRNKASHNPKVRRRVLIPNLSDYGGAVLLPISANIGEKLFCDPVSRARRSARTRFSSRYKTAFLISTHGKIPVWNAAASISVSR